MKENKTSSHAGQGLPNMTENEAREHIEKLLWKNGAICPHCKSKNVYKMTGETIRAGLHRCRECEKQFTVTVGTIFEDSHIPLATWIKAFHLMCSSKKGVSALQLQRNLELGSYRSAWHMAHRIRLAMKCEPLAGGLKGIVEVDEAYIGGKPRPGTGPHKRGRGTDKAPVIVLVERGGACQPYTFKDGMKNKASNKMPGPKAILLLGMGTKALKSETTNVVQPGKSSKTHPGRGGMAVSLAPLTPDEALAAALQVKLADVKKLERENGKSNTK